MKKIFIFPMLFCASLVQAQSNFLSPNDESIQLIDRMETLNGQFSDHTFSNVRAMSAQSVVTYLSQNRNSNQSIGLSNIDNFRIQQVIENNGEWLPPNGMGANETKFPLLNTFYKTKTDFVVVNNGRSYLSINPLLGAFYNTQSINDQRDRYAFAYGVAVKYKLRNWLSFYGSIQRNEEQATENMSSYYLSHNAIPYTATKLRNNEIPTKFKSIIPRLQLNFPLLKNYISGSIGYDYQRFGDGYRTMFLSEFSGPVAYAKINTKVWKLNYQNVFMKLDYGNFSDPYLNDVFSHIDYTLPKTSKFATAHYLSYNATKWLNIGLFESVVFSRNNGFDLNYLNPIIFYRAIERSLGSPDKVAIGLNAKAIVTKGVNLYGQFLINEFTAKEFFGSNGYMHNKWGAQIGAKYFNAFQVENLDLQVEGNFIRPYTFQHRNTGLPIVYADFTNRQLPLNYDLGAGVKELVVLARYQPLQKLVINARYNIYQQGIDTGIMNLGNNPSRPYDLNIPNGYGVKLINGIALNTQIFTIKGSYQIKPNLYFDLGFTHRSNVYADDYKAKSQTNYLETGLRLNIAAKDNNYL